MPVGLKSLPARLALPAAGLILAAASIYSAHQAAPAWVLTRAVPAGSAVTRQDFRPVVQFGTAPPPGHAVARVSLEPGQTVVAADFRQGGAGAPAGASLAVAVNAGALTGVAPGDRVEFAVAGRHGAWISPPVVVAALLASAYGGAGTITISAPVAVLAAMVQHNLSAASLINLGPMP